MHGAGGGVTGAGGAVTGAGGGVTGAGEGFTYKIFERTNQNVTTIGAGKTSLEGADLETECFWPNCKCGMLKREDGIYYYSCNCY